MDVAGYPPTVTFCGDVRSAVPGADAMKSTTSARLHPHPRHVVAVLGDDAGKGRDIACRCISQVDHLDVDGGHNRHSASRVPARRLRPSTRWAGFPGFPPEAIGESSAARLQGVLDTAIQAGPFAGITAAVIVADRGAWAGASGSAGGMPITPESRRPTHSSAKRIVAAQVLRLAEDGRVGLDDPASGYLPRNWRSSTRMAPRSGRC